MGIRIKNVIPVTSDVMTPEMVEYICKYLGPETTVESEKLTVGPPSVENEYDEALAAPGVVELCMKAEKEGFDAIFVNCFSEPGVKAARECVDIPVFGGFEPAAHLALGLADKISIVTVVPNVVPLMEGNLAKAHLDKRFVSIRNVNIPVQDLQDHEKVCKAVLEEAVRAIREDGAQAIVLGCTGFVDVAETVRENLCTQYGYDVPVLEAGQSAVMVCELCAKMGLRQSRLTYMRPPER